MRNRRPGPASCFVIPIVLALHASACAGGPQPASDANVDAHADANANSADAHADSAFDASTASGALVVEVSDADSDELALTVSVRTLADNSLDVVVDYAAAAGTDFRIAIACVDATCDVSAFDATATNVLDTRPTLLEAALGAVTFALLASESFSGFGPGAIRPLDDPRHVDGCFDGDFACTYVPGPTLTGLRVRILGVVSAVLPWRDCCLEHDRAFFCGGDDAALLAATLALATCVYASSWPSVDSVSLAVVAALHGAVTGLWGRGASSVIARHFANVGNTGDFAQRQATCLCSIGGTPVVLCTDACRTNTCELPGARGLDIAAWRTRSTCMSCTTHLDCAACTADPACGWCEADGGCHEGTDAGATDRSSCASGWDWLATACPSTSSCGDGTCGTGENCASCVSDCGVCTPACGNHVCEATESCTSCAGDCGACPVTCGDGSCAGTEDCRTCPGDCGACPARCGDGTCSTSESCSTCTMDCGTCGPTCGDGACTGGESCSASSCPIDCCFDFDDFSGSGGPVALSMSSPSWIATPPTVRIEHVDVEYPTSYATATASVASGRLSLATNVVTTPPPFVPSVGTATLQFSGHPSGSLVAGTPIAFVIGFRCRTGGHNILVTGSTGTQVAVPCPAGGAFAEMRVPLSMPTVVSGGYWGATVSVGTVSDVIDVDFAAIAPP